MWTSLHTRPAPVAAVLATGLAMGLAGCGGGATSATSPTPPAASSLPRAGEIILHDDFDDDTNGWGVLHDPAFGSSDYAGGSYVWQETGRVFALVPATLGERFDAGTLSMSDVVIDAEVTITKGGGVVGLQCRNSPDTDAGFQWYDFVARDGYAAIRLSDDKSNIQVLAQSEDVSLPLGTSFSITAGCVTAGDDVELTMAVNDTPALAASVPAGPTDGVPGIVGWTYPLHSELDVAWNQFTVSRPAA